MEKKSNIFTKDELFILKASLNEICNALDIYDFETRMGATKENTLTLLNKINRLLSQKEE